MDHTSVLLNESIDLLDIKADGIYVDGTLGRAGHSSEILKKLTTGHLYSFDIDDVAIEQSQEKLSSISNSFTLIQANFACMKEELNKIGVSSVDGILLDLGVSSPQFDDPKRGFSYRFDSRLDMRMDQGQSLDAYEVVNTYPFEKLVYIFNKYGQEKFSKNIARRIEKERSVKPIETTLQLVEVIKKALPASELSKKGHPAKQVFQAIRIEVNHELENLEKVIAVALDLLNPNGRLVVITFHSLEDEIVKKAFRKASTAEVINKRIPLKADEMPTSEYQLVNKKIIVATEEELENNHRSHSAKLRAIERKKTYEENKKVQI